MHCFVVVLKSNLVMYDGTLNSDLVHLVAVDRACKRSYFDMESSVVDIDCIVVVVLFVVVEAVVEDFHRTDTNVVDEED